MRRLTKFDHWMFVIVMTVGRAAQLVIIGMSAALLFGWWKP